MSFAPRFLAILLAFFLAACASTPATPPTEIRVMTSGGFTAAFKELYPQFERTTGHKVIPAYGASQGGAPDSIPSRLARGEPVDVVILSASALDGLIKEGKVAAGSRVDLVHSQIGMVVKAGAPKPDISSLDAFRRTVLAAKSIAYSASASGVYLSTELFPKMGIWEEIKGKSQRIESARVATIVARGEAEIGFQQVSELLEIGGVDFVGVLPEGAQRVTTFSAGLGAAAKQPEAARQLVRFFKSAEAEPVIRKAGLEPARP
jgi:molybdate transport system substrate-binding protein